MVADMENPAAGGSARGVSVADRAAKQIDPENMPPVAAMQARWLAARIAQCHLKDAAVRL
jgi:hypothetical protein